MKHFTVRVETRQTLALRGLGFVSVGDWHWQDVSVPVDEAVLTEPERGPQGGFLYAELRDSKEARWCFGRSQEKLYLAVKRAIAKARKGGSGK